MTTLEQLRHRKAEYQGMPWWTFDSDRIKVTRRELGEIQTLIDGIEERVLRPISLEEKITCTQRHEVEMQRRRVVRRTKRSQAEDQGLERLLAELQGGDSEIRGRESQHNAGLGADLSGSPRAAILGKDRKMREKCKRVMKWVVLTALLFSLGVATATLFAGCNTVSGFGVDLTRGAEGLSVDPAVRRAAPRR